MGRRARIKNRGARFCQVCLDSLESSGSIKYSLPKPDIPTGGRLYHFCQAWQNITTDQWTVCDKKRVSYSISCPSQLGQSSFSVFEETSSRSREDLTPSRGDRIYAGKACHRTSFFTSSEGKLLQPIISGSEKVQRMETSDGSFQIEPVHPYSSFQNGNYRLSSSCITEEQLGHIKGCILPHSHPPQVQEVSPLPFYGENLPISSDSVRALPSSLHFHQSSENDSEALSSPGNAFACIPGHWLQPSTSQSLFIQYWDQLLRTVLSLGTNQS